MIHTTITNFRENLFDLLEQTLKQDETVTISTKGGNAVMVREDTYNALLETLYLSSIPGLKGSILEGAKTPTSNLIAESEAQW